MNIPTTSASGIITVSFSLFVLDGVTSQAWKPDVENGMKLLLRVYLLSKESWISPPMDHAPVATEMN
jgi:hypothetical protein